MRLTPFCMSDLSNDSTSCHLHDSPDDPNYWVERFHDRGPRPSQEHLQAFWNYFSSDWLADTPQHLHRLRDTSLRRLHPDFKRFVAEQRLQYWKPSAATWNQYATSLFWVDLSFPKEIDLMNQAYESLYGRANYPDFTPLATIERRQLALYLMEICPEQPDNVAQLPWWQQTHDPLEMLSHVVASPHWRRLTYLSFYNHPASSVWLANFYEWRSELSSPEFAALFQTLYADPQFPEAQRPSLEFLEDIFLTTLEWAHRGQQQQDPLCSTLIESWKTWHSWGLDLIKAQSSLSAKGLSLEDPWGFLQSLRYQQSLEQALLSTSESSTPFSTPLAQDSASTISLSNSPGLKKRL